MTQPLISIIIPVYNAERYLGRCIESVLGQSYKNLEIILVNDGSKDNSGKICDEYAELDKRIIVIHKENGGASSARNVALKQFSGEYAAFVDSDDFVHSEYILHMYNLLTENDCDIVQTDYFKGNSDFFPEDDLVERYKVVDKYFCLSGFEYKVVVWGKLFKSDIVRDIHFPEGVIYEDDATYYQFVYKSDKVCLSNKKLYYYFLTDVSVMRNNDVRLDFFDIYRNRIKFFNEKEDDFGVKKSYERYAIVLILNYSNLKLKRTSKDLYKQVLDEYKSIFKESVKTSNKIYKILFSMFRIMPDFMAKIISLVRNG